MKRFETEAKTSGFTLYAAMRLRLFLCEFETAESASPALACAQSARRPLHEAKLALPLAADRPEIYRVELAPLRNSILKR
jgi:hypothetical protein